MSFTAPANNGGTAITGYTVTASSGGFTATGTASPISVTGLSNGTAYTFTVVATNSVGNSAASTASNSVTPSDTPIVPDAPTAVTAAAGHASATVSFTASASNGGAAILDYTVTSNPDNITATGTASPISVPGLTNGTLYTFTVKARNSVGNSSASSASNSVMPTAAPTAPNVPTAVTATAGNASASVSFTAPADNGGAAITGYTVTSSPGGFTATGTASPILVTSLSNGTAYTFTVVATNSVGNSSPSSASNPAVTPVTVPSAPTAVTASPGDVSATVSFTPPASTGGTAITGYTVTSIPADGTDSNAGTTGLSHNITGLTNGTIYHFTVKAHNSVGDSPASLQSNPVTPTNGWTVPGVPTAVTAAAGNASATVSFTAPADGGTAITGYTVTSNPLGGTDSDANTTGLTHAITGLTNGQAYTFTVKATNSVGTGYASAPSNSVTPALTFVSVSGTISGPWVEGVTITPVGGTTTTALTHADGTYSLNLSPGSYTLTPSLPGYTFSPIASFTVSSAALTGKDSTATSATASYSISGTVSYPSPTKTGGILVQAFYTGCANCSVAATVIAGPGSYTLRGLQPGNYMVVAEMDAQGTGLANANNPISWPPVSADITAASLTRNMVLADPAVPAAVAPTDLQVAPDSGGGLLIYTPAVDGLGQEIATHYLLTWGTTSTAIGSGSVNFAAQGLDNSMYLLHGLTNGTYYFQLTACVGGTSCASGASSTAASLVTGAVAIGNTTGAYTVSGSFSGFSGATGPMYIVIHNNGGVYVKRIASPATAGSYSIAGVAPGSYKVFAMIDQNDDGLISVGDITNGNEFSITVTGNTTANLPTLSNAPSSARVGTDHQFDGTTHHYAIETAVNDGVKRVVSATLFSGPNVAVPLDMKWGNGSGTFNNYSFIGTTAPVPGATYQFKVLYSDLTYGIISANVPPLMNSFATLAAVSDPAGTPGFSWSAPGGLPLASYLYTLSVYDGAGVNWYYPGNSNGMPSSQISLAYGAAGGSPNTAPVLSSGTTYTWQVQVKDANSLNTTTRQSTFTH